MIVPLSAYKGEWGLHRSPYLREAWLLLGIVCKDYSAIWHLGYSVIPRSWVWISVKLKPSPVAILACFWSRLTSLAVVLTGFGNPKLLGDVILAHGGSKQKILCIPWWGSYGVTRDRFCGLFWPVFWSSDRFCGLRTGFVVSPDRFCGLFWPVLRSFDRSCNLKRRWEGRYCMMSQSVRWYAEIFRRDIPPRTGRSGDGRYYDVTKPWMIGQHSSNFLKVLSFERLKEGDLSHWWSSEEVTLDRFCGLWDRCFAEILVTGEAEEARSRRYYALTTQLQVIRDRVW